MAPEQYEKNVATRPGSNRPGGVRDQAARKGRRQPSAPADRREVPQEDYQRLQAGAGSGDLLAAELAERRSRRGSSSKRRPSPKVNVEPPHTTDFALLTCRSRGVRRSASPAGAVRLHPAPVPRHDLRSDQPARLPQQPADGIPHAGDPAAFLGSLESAGTVKSEFGRFAEVLANTKRQLQTVANTHRFRRKSGRARSSASLKDVRGTAGTESCKETCSSKRSASAGIRPGSQVATAPNGAATISRRTPRRKICNRGKRIARGDWRCLAILARFVVPLALPWRRSPMPWCRSWTASPSSGSCRDPRCARRAHRADRAGAARRADARAARRACTRARYFDRIMRSASSRSASAIAPRQARLRDQPFPAAVRCAAPTQRPQARAGCSSSPDARCTSGRTRSPPKS